MGEVYWAPADDKLFINTITWYAQTFTPLWTHRLDHLRIDLAVWVPGAPCKVAIQALKPDGTPTGIDLSKVYYTHTDFLHFFGMHTLQPLVDSVQCLKGVGYAIVIGLEGINPLAVMQIERVKPPGGYPRGKLMKSNDGGLTWDTTDLGDMPFGEYGDPPLAPSPYNPPIQYFAPTIFSQTNFLTSACTRVATTEPCTLRAYVTKTKPVPIESWQPRRGAEVFCLDHYVFKDWFAYNQLEEWDSLYHTFLIKRLKKDEPYWVCFLGEANFHPANSSGPIMSLIHPEAPPFTTIRRPNAPGDLCYIKREVGAPCPNHWENVDEATPDEDTSYIYEAFGITTADYDIYQIPDLLPIDSGPFEQLHITARVKRIGGYAYAFKAAIAFKTHGVVYTSTPVTSWGTSWGNMHTHQYVNPFTLLPWTAQELNDVQIGIWLQAYWGVGWQTWSACTQVYCRIIHLCEAYN